MAYRDPEKHRTYQREWRRKRYQTDPDFREKEKETARNRWIEKNKCPEFRKKKALATVRLKAKYIKTIQDILDEFYKNGCNRCEEEDIDCLCAHHENPKEKAFPIGSVKSLRPSREKLINELKKCTPLCCNCHTKLHARLRREDGRKKLQA